MASEITKELRGYADGGFAFPKAIRRELDGIADRIDENVENLAARREYAAFLRGMGTNRQAPVPPVKVSLDDGAYMPERAHPTDAGADLRTPYDFTLPWMGERAVRTGVHVEIPHGYVGMLKSKSGLNVKHGITSEGVIDEGYTGEIVVKLRNHSDADKRFEVGDKVTQLVIMPVIYPAFEQVESIGGGERGADGFGSTGR